jgi:hypothetical protein
MSPAALPRFLSGFPAPLHFAMKISGGNFPDEVFELPLMPGGRNRDPISIDGYFYSRILIDLSLFGERFWYPDRQAVAPPLH